MLGRGALLLAAGFSICFTALLIAGLNGGPTMNGAAVTEYVLAIQLALLNLHAVSLMAYTGRGQAGARFDFLGGLPALWHEEAVRGQA